MTLKDHKSAGKRVVIQNPDGIFKIELEKKQQHLLVVDKRLKMDNFMRKLFH